MNERLEAIVSGRVQMVMYRDFACRKARSLKLIGEVKNLRDGTVSVIAEGSHDVLERFIGLLKEGSVLSHVADVATVYKPASGTYTSFNISYD